MKKSILLVIALLASIACNSNFPNVPIRPACEDYGAEKTLTFTSQYDHYPIGIYIDSESDSLDVRKGIDQWNIAMARPLFIESSDKENGVFSIEIVSYVKTFNEDLFTDNFSQIDHGGLGIVTFRSLLDTRCLIIYKTDAYHLISHALGHCLGFNDNEDLGSIMNPCPGKESKITDEMKKHLETLRLIFPPML